MHSSIKNEPVKIASPESVLNAQIALYPDKKNVKKLQQFAVGDLVRLSRLRGKFEKDTFNWTLELFKISKVYKRTPHHVYNIQELSGAPVGGLFNATELQRVFKK